MDLDFQLFQNFQSSLSPETLIPPPADDHGQQEGWGNCFRSLWLAGMWVGPIFPSLPPSLPPSLLSATPL